MANSPVDNLISVWLTSPQSETGTRPPAIARWIAAHRTSLTWTHVGAVVTTSPPSKSAISTASAAEKLLELAWQAFTATRALGRNTARRISLGVSQWS